MSDTVYQFSVEAIDGGQVNLNTYRGHVLCIVNVASRWGKTDVNYRQLVQLAEKYPQVSDENVMKQHKFFLIYFNLILLCISAQNLSLPL